MTSHGILEFLGNLIWVNQQKSIQLRPLTMGLCEIGSEVCAAQSGDQLPDLQLLELRLPAISPSFHASPQYKTTGVTDGKTKKTGALKA
jgi:hypothetical protein